MRVCARVSTRFEVGVGGTYVEGSWAWEGALFCQKIASPRVGAARGRSRGRLRKPSNISLPDLAKLLLEA